LGAGAKNRKDSENGQTDMFQMFGVNGKAHLHLKEGINVDKKQKMAWEKELLGMYISEHPLKEFKDLLKNKTTGLDAITKDYIDKKVIIGGVVTKIQKVLTRSKEMMIFATMEDMSARTEVLVFPKTLQLNPSLWQEDKLMLVQGRVSENKDGEIKIIAEKARELKESDLHKQEKSIKTISMRIKNKNRELFSKIKEILRSSAGNHQVILKLQYDDDIQKIMLPFTVNLNDNIQKQLEQVVGEPVEIGD